MADETFDTRAAETRFKAAMKGVEDIRFKFMRDVVDWNWKQGPPQSAEEERKQRADIREKLDETYKRIDTFLKYDLPK